ncbi:MAG: rhodanese-like domain-containing protein [Daejeonella sp.]
MLVEQFYDKGLAQGSYAIISSQDMIIIDPGRNPQPYFDFAAKHSARIIGVIETHPHADFVSSHLEIHHKTGAIIYVSKLVGANYPHTPFDEGDVIQLGEIKLKAMNTPGHSPDSICILLVDEAGKEYALFSGDTLFVGDVGRPDLRENVGNLTAKKEELAKAMYHTTREKLMKLPENVLVYPAHGPGSLCGKNMSPDLYSTIGKELRENYALQLMDEMDFVKKLTEDQPFVPKYFGYNVDLNKKGAESFEDSVSAVPRLNNNAELNKSIVVIDTRPEDKFKSGHLKGSINLQDGGKFETWLGSILFPGEPFYLIADNTIALETVIRKSAKIGYEKQITGALLTPSILTETTPVLDVNQFNSNPENYTIVDIRNESEVKNGKIFNKALTIPLPELRERVKEIPTAKPIIIHCAAGYRSAIGASIVAQQVSGIPIMDLSELITKYQVQH